MKMSTMLKKRMLIASMTVALLLSGCGKAATTNDASNTASSIETEASGAASLAASEELILESGSSSEGNSTEDKNIATTEVSSDASSDSSSKVAEATDKTKESDSTKDSEKAKEAGNTKDSDKAKESDSTKDSDKAKDTDSTKNTDETKESSSAKDADKSQETSKTEEAQKAEEASQPQQPQKVDYGRILFVGDSRTVDIFDAGESALYGRNEGGVSVYCENGGSFSFFRSTVEGVGLDNFDTLVSWMGCNDRGNFGEYESYYNNLLSMGKNVVVCTVGPTEDQYLVDEYDQTYYTNSLVTAYNGSLVSWANAHGVKVIDLYSYLSGNSGYYLDPADGIHYQPQPTYGIWTYIFSQM